MRQLGQTLHGDDDSRSRAPVVGPPFALLRLRDVEWKYRVTLQRSSTWWHRAVI